MKIKLSVLGLCLGTVLFNGCNDDVNLVGPSIQPDDDKIAVYVDTFEIKTSTVLMDSIYARTQTALLGEIYDPQFGYLKSDYICQFRTPEGFKFKYTPIDGKIDSMSLRLFYQSWVGDSLAPMRLQVYAVTQQLDKKYYTNIDPSDYCDMQTTLGMKTYTAYDRSVPDSVRNETDNYTGELTYYPNVVVQMPNELGQKFYDESVNNPSTFANQEAFNNFFPGLYLTNTFGSGNILKIDNSYLYIYYKYTIEGSEGQDSIVNATEIFNVTKEVIQLNRFENMGIEELLQPNDEYTFIKSPAGVCTRIVFPAKEMASVIDDRIINNLPLTLYAMPQNDWQYALDLPGYLMLVPEDSVITFFEEGQIENYKTSYLGTYASSTQSYSFGNISNLIKNQLEKDPDKDISMLAIPVSRSVGQDYYYNYYTTAISHYLSPSGVKLRKDGDKLKVVLTTSAY